MEFVLGIAIAILNIVHSATKIFGGDSAEYSFIARTFTLAHPPGYPLYSLLLNLLRISIPGLQEFMRNALLSAVPSGITAAITYRLLRKMRIAPFIAVAAVCAFAFALPVWIYSLVPEVFSLNLLLMVSITTLVLRASLGNRFSSLCAAFFLMGLAVSHHHTAVLFAPGWIYLLRKQGAVIRKHLIPLLLLLIVGTFFYLYAPLSSRFSGWFDIENAQTLTGFLRLISRASYGTFKAYSSSTPDLNNQLFILLSYVVMLMQDFKPLGFLLMITGAVLAILSRKLRTYFLFFWIPPMVFIFITNFVLNASFTISTFERFLMPLYWIGALLIAYALSWTHALYLTILNRYITNDKLLIFARTAFVLVILLYPVLLFLQNYPTVRSLRSLTAFEDYADHILRTPPSGSILFVQGDTPLFTVQYRYYISRIRPDVYFIQPGLLNRPTYVAFLKKYYGKRIQLPSTAETDLNTAYTNFIRANARSHHIFSNTKQQMGNWFPYGLLWKYSVNEGEQNAQIPDLLKKNKQLWKMYNSPLITSSTRNIPYFQNVVDSYTDMQLALALHLVVLNKIEDAKSILIPLSQNHPQFHDVRASLLGIYTLERNCTAASAQYKAIPAWYFYKASLNLNIAVNYISVCGDSSAQSLKIKKYAEGK